MERDWGNLPKHLLDSVAEKLLIPSDYLGFSLACKSWYSVAKDNKSKHSKMTAPLLLFYTGRRDYWKFYNIIDKKVLEFEVRVRVLPNQMLVGSSKGWLIFMKGYADRYDITLMNPLFRVRGQREKENSIIRLPPLYPLFWDLYYMCDYKLSKVMLTADPILNPKDCIVMVMHLGLRTLAFLRLEKDAKWTFLEETIEYAIDGCGLLEEVILVGSKFYAVGLNRSKLFSFVVTAESDSDMKLVCKETLDFDDRTTKRYIFEGEDNKLWLVKRYIEYDEYERMRMTNSFEAFQMDFQRGKWIRKNTLGDVALFVGNNTSICVPASNNSGLQSNCIYFNHDYDRFGCDFFNRCYDFGVYNVEDKQFIQVYPDHIEMLLKMCCPLPIWIVPTLSFHL